MPAQTEHHVGGTKHFECRVGGFPRPQIRWYKDGREITESTRYQFDHSNDGVISMVIHNITHEDEGHYRCRAENSEGLASTSAYLLVKAHKDVPDEPSTSVHSMQFEEAVAYTDKYKRAREIRKKIEALDNEPSYEDSNLIKSKEKRQREEEKEELTWKSLETVISAQRTSTQLISTSTFSSKQKEEDTEEEESKISKDMLEKTYHSSDDDQDSVRLMTISERSEPISLQESLKDFEEEEEKSLLMRQTARLFSHELDEDEDFFRKDSAYQAVLTGMVGEQVMQELLQQEEKASKVEDSLLKTVTEKVTKTEVRSAVSKTVTSRDIDGQSSVVKEFTQTVSEERVDKAKTDTKPASGDESKLTSHVSKQQVENVGIETNSTLSAMTESSEASIKDEAENVKSVIPEKVGTLKEDVVKEIEKETHSEKTSVVNEVTVEEKLSHDNVDSQIAVSEDPKISRESSREVPIVSSQEVIVSETDLKLEDDEEESVSDSETEGSVGSVVDVIVTPVTSSQKQETQDSVSDYDKVESNENLKESGLGQNRYNDDKGSQGSRGDHPIIQPAVDGSGVEGSTVEVVEPGTSWVQKVALDKPEPEETEDATAIGGDKEQTSKPTIKQKMEDIKIETGKTLRLRTQVQATPRADVTWSKEGEVIIAGERITIITEDDVYTLEIENVGEADAGRYRMTAINSAGSVYSEVLVNIVGRPQQPSDLSPSLPIGHPRFVTRPQNVTVAEFESIKLSCSVQGEPMPKVSWEKDGEKLRMSKRLRLYETRGVFYLEIPEAEAEDAGEYVCVAVNSQGTVTATVTVSMQGMENVVQISGEPEVTAELTEGATGGAVESSSDVCTSDSRSVRYLKLFGMAAAFSLAAIGVKKLMENLPK